MLIPIRKLFLSQLLIGCFLIVMYVVSGGLSWDVFGKFNLDGEANIPSWYSTVLLFSVSLCSLAIYGLSHAHSHTRFWIFFGGVFCFLSLDEMVGIHEILEQVITVKWVFLYAPFVAAFYIVCVFYCNHIGQAVLRNWLLGGLVVYALGGLVCETISHVFYPLPRLLQYLEFVLEEGLEMLGAIMVLTGCLHELDRLLIAKRHGD